MKSRRLRTRLEDEGPSNLDIPAVARRLNPSVWAHKRTYNERSSLTDTIEGAKLDSHASEL
jgi:hypothetical protein